MFGSPFQVEVGENAVNVWAGYLRVSFRTWLAHSASLALLLGHRLLLERPVHQPFDGCGARWEILLEAESV